MAKRTWLSYLLWLVGGCWGLHLFYLKRDRQAFIWFATFGGFGFGYFRDLFTIPRYVREANASQTVVTIGAGVRPDQEEQDSSPGPSISASRLGLSAAVGNLFAVILQYCIPEEWMFLHPEINLPTVLWVAVNCLGPIGASIGIHTVLNIGRQSCSFKYPFLGCFGVASLYVLGKASINFTWMSVLATVISMYYGSRHQRKTRTYRRRKAFLVLVTCSMIYVSLCVSAVYFNVSVTTENGEEIKVHEALEYFFQSEAWSQTKTVLEHLYEQYKHNGWKPFYDEFVKALDPQGESHAQKLLGVNSGTTDEELRKRYKTLSRQWHPDKHPNNKEEASRKFMEIQESYKRLSNINTKRNARRQSQRA